MRKALSILAFTSLFAAAFLGAQQNGKALLDQGRARKTAGDLQGATEAFEKVVADFAASDRNATANALVELGDIAGALGQTSRARGYYDRVRNDFKDQSAEAEVAANRIKTGSTAAGAATSTSGSGPSNSGARAGTKVTIQTPYAEDPYSLALSPDGRTVVFQVTTPDGKRQLWRQAVDPAAKPESIAGSDGAGPNAFPFFAPDGKSVVFFAKAKLWQLDLAGGTARELAEVPYSWGGSWSGDSIVVASRGNPGPIELLRGGRLSAATAAGNLVQPHFIDERRFLYFVKAPIITPANAGTIEVSSLDGPIAGRGLPAAQAATYTNGFVVYATTAGILNAIRFDPKELAPIGSPFVLAERVGVERRYAGIAAFTASAGGAVAYRENSIMNRQLMWIDRNGDLVGTVGTPDSTTPGLPRVSPDGRSIVYFRQAGQAALGSIWLIDATTGAMRLLQDGANTAVWSPAGDRIMFAALRGRGGIPIGPMLLERPVNAGGNGGAQLGPDNGVLMPQDLTANGAVLYLTNIGATGMGSGDLFVLPPDRGTPIPVAQTPAAERNGRFSPDGKWIAYQSDEGGRIEVYVQPFPGNISQRQRVSLNGGLSPQWGRKGRELYFISGDNRLMVSTAGSGPEQGSLEFATPKALFKGPLPQGAEYDTALDGDRFLILAPVGEPSPIVVLTNWAPER